MEYILIPTSSKNETAFFMDLFSKMHKPTTTISGEDMEDLAFVAALKEAEQTPKGNLSDVKSQLSKIASIE